MEDIVDAPRKIIPEIGIAKACESISDERSKAILQVYNNFYLAEMDVKEAQITGKFGSHQPQFIKVAKEAKHSGSVLYAPCKLGQLYWFCEMMRLVKEDGKQSVVVCAGKTPEMITTCAQLMGSFLILCKGLSADEVSEVFRPLIPRFLDYGDSPRHRFSVLDCWQAIFRAKSLGWVDFESKAVDIDRAIDMHEYLHYDSHLNGSLHVIVPSKLLVFRCPSDLPLRRRSAADAAASRADGGKLWRDCKGERLFSAAYYADILHDFDVQAVVRSSAASYSVRGFYRRVPLCSRAGGGGGGAERRVR
jgi:hypothetical protein